MNKTKTKKAKAPRVDTTWEIKDRTYVLRRGFSPLSYKIRTSGIFYFDEDLGYEREIKYVENQKTSFVDEMKGDQRLAHVIFRNGVLEVPKEKQTLQKFLSFHHPERNKLYEEINLVKQAKDDLSDLEIEIEALNAAKNLDVEHSEAILRVEIGSSVNKMTSKEIRRDILLMAKNNPRLFLDLAADENVDLRNFGIKAVEARVLTLSPDQRNFTWSSTKRKVMTVPFDEHPYSALAAFFKTDEGLEIYKNIEKRLK